jgi:hypothetical protein
MSRKKITIEDIQKVKEILDKMAPREFQKFKIYPGDFEALKNAGHTNDVNLLIAGKHPFAELTFWPPIN